MQSWQKVCVCLCVCVTLVKTQIKRRGKFEERVRARSEIRISPPIYFRTNARPFILFCRANKIVKKKKEKPGRELSDENANKIRCEYS